MRVPTAEPRTIIRSPATPAHTPIAGSGAPSSPNISIAAAPCATRQTDADERTGDPGPDAAPFVEGVGEQAHQAADEEAEPHAPALAAWHPQPRPRRGRVRPTRPPPSTGPWRRARGRARCRRSRAGCTCRRRCSAGSGGVTTGPRPSSADEPSGSVTSGTEPSGSVMSGAVTSGGAKTPPSPTSRPSSAVVGVADVA